MTKRSVLIGVMSEICMKSKLILESIKKDKKMVRSQELIARLERMEVEMEECSKQFDKLFAK